MKLLEPIRINQWHLNSRLVMAPMTRGFANDKSGVIHSDTIAYYQKRARDGIGLIITEGITINPESKGTVGIPSLYTDQQVEAWKTVTDAVHKENGVIIAQLWHVGRLSHSYFTGGKKPLAPSAIRAEGLTHKVKLPYEEPKEMTHEDIYITIRDYVCAAKNALKAGFDGIEIHAAHGYLIDQFHSPFTNKRTDRYAYETNKYLFLEELLQHMIKEVGKERLIVRFSEHKDDCPQFVWETPEEEIKQLTELFKRMNLQFIHASAQHFNHPLTNHSLTFHQLIRKHWSLPIIGVGDLNPTTAEEALEKDEITLAAIGRPLLANPDFVEKVQQGKKLIEYNPTLHLRNLI